MAETRLFNSQFCDESPARARQSGEKAQFQPIARPQSQMMPQDTGASAQNGVSRRGRGGPQSREGRHVRKSIIAESDPGGLTQMRDISPDIVSSLSSRARAWWRKVGGDSAASPSELILLRTIIAIAFALCLGAGAVLLVWSLPTQADQTPISGIRKFTTFVDSNKDEISTVSNAIIAFFTVILGTATIFLVIDARGTAVRQLRAYASAEVLGNFENANQPGGEIQITINIHNSGVTPAYNFKLISVRRTFEPGDRLDFSMPTEEFRSQTPLGPRSSAQNTLAIPSVPETRTLYVFGEATYTDAFDKPRFGNYALELANAAWYNSPVLEAPVTETGAPVLDEIEVTPEMIEAGVLALFEYDPNFSNEAEVVRKIIEIGLRFSHNRQTDRLNALFAGSQL